MHSFSLRGIATKAFYGPNAFSLGTGTTGYGTRITSGSGPGSTTGGVPLPYGSGNSSGGSGGGGGSFSFTRRVNSANNIVALAAGPGKAMYADSTNAIFLSTDGGHTWVAKNSPPSLPNTLLYENGIWIAGLNNDISKSADDGVTWSAAIPTGILGFITPLASRSASNILAISSAANPSNNFATSVNDGTTWGNAGSVNSLFNAAYALWDGAQYVTLGTDPTGNFSTILTSATGVAFASTIFNTAENVNNTNFNVVAFGLSLYAVLMGGSFTLRVANTAAGLATAIASNLPDTANVAQMITFADGFFYTFFQNGNGTVWRTATPQIPASWIQGTLNFTSFPLSLTVLSAYDSTNNSLIVTNGAGQLATLGPSTSIAVYQDWSPGGASAGKAAVDAGKNGVVLIITGQSLTGNFPTPTYGGNAPDISLTGNNGSCWMFVWYLSNTPPASAVLNGVANTTLIAMVLINVASNDVPHQSAFGLPPRVDNYGTVTVGNYVVGAAKAVNGQVPHVASSDTAAVTTSGTGNPYNIGTVTAFWQAPQSGAAAYTWTTQGGPLNNTLSINFSP